MKEKLPVIAVFDIGKTNKKLLVFDSRYEVVSEESTSFPEVPDEDGFPSEDLDSLTHWIEQHLARLKQSDRFDLKAINFTTYGASVVYVDEAGKRIASLYNYLKPYPPELMEQFQTLNGGVGKIGVETSSPIMGHLNAGLQLYWLKQTQPDTFAKVSSVLHFPQFLSFLVTGKKLAEMTNLGCHSAMWDFTEKKYHPWVYNTGISPKLCEVVNGSEAIPVDGPEGRIYVGVGLHDSSAAVIPYLRSFTEPFVIVSTGTWTVSLNPFNREKPRAEELNNGCLSYLTYEGEPVKASMLFAGNDHDQQVNRIAAHFGVEPAYFRTLAYNPQWVPAPGVNDEIANKFPAADSPTAPGVFHTRDLQVFTSAEHAYHQLLIDIINRQADATGMVLAGSTVRNMYVDGGFCQNKIYMQLLADAFPAMEVYATSMVQGTALGAALAIHDHWNTEPLPASLIKLRHWSKSSSRQPVG